jgi:hypothetical protein
MWFQLDAEDLGQANHSVGCGSKTLPYDSEFYGFFFPSLMLYDLRERL